MASTVDSILLNTLLSQILGAVASFGSTILQSLGLINLDIKDNLGQVEQRLGDIIRGEIGEIDDIVGGTLAKVGADIAQTVADSNVVTQTAIEKMGREINAVNTEAAEVITRSVLKQEQTLAGVEGTINNLLDVLTDSLKVQIDNVVNVDGSLITDITDQIEQLIKDENRATESVVAIFEETLQTIVADVIAEGDAIGDGVVDAGELVQTAINEVAEKLQTANELFEADAIGDYIPDVIKKVFDVLAEPATILSDDLEQSFGDLVALEFRSEGNFCSGDIQEALKQIDNPYVRAVINGVILALQAVTVPIALAQQRGQICLQEDGLEHPWQVMQPGDVNAAFRRTIMTFDEAVREIRLNGFDEARAQRLLASGDQIPDLTFLLSAWFRNVLSDDALDFELKGLGFTPPRIDLIKEVAFFIPPVQDLITMAVREVFSPEIARKQGQFEDFPDDFARYARQQGVSDEWARNYWAAHWSLPSPQMGFEMLHRGVINEDELRDLLRSLDVMPFWRDKLTAISYNPLTRVDTRRLFVDGVIDEADVKRAYLDQGYNDQVATWLTEWTLLQADDDDVDDISIADDLTRSTLLRFYDRGTLDRESTFTFMVESGINPIAAQLFLDNSDLEAELRDRDEEINIVLDKFRVGETSFTEASDEMAGLGLPSQELEQARLKLEKARIDKVKTPSRADLDKFVTSGLIDSSTYLDVMGNLGYSTFWRERYLQLALGA